MTRDRELMRLVDRVAEHFECDREQAAFMRQHALANPEFHLAGLQRVAELEAITGTTEGLGL